MQGLHPLSGVSLTFRSTPPVYDSTSPKVTIKKSGSEHGLNEAGLGEANRGTGTCFNLSQVSREQTGKVVENYVLCHGFPGLWSCRE